MTALTSAELKIGDRVTYMPPQARGDRGNPFCRSGVITGIVCECVYVRDTDGIVEQRRAEDLILLT